MEKVGAKLAPVDICDDIIASAALTYMIENNLKDANKLCRYHDYVPKKSYYIRLFQKRTASPLKKTILCFSKILRILLVDFCFPKWKFFGNVAKY